MKQKLLENLEDRRAFQKREIKEMLEAQIKHLPVTPRTPSRQNSSRNSNSRHIKIDNFLQKLLTDQVAMNNWVSTDLDGFTKTKRQNLPPLWH